MTIVANDVGAMGGMERVLTELILGLEEMGFSVTVIARTCALPARAGVTFRRVRGPRRPFLLAYPWFLLAGSLAVWRWRRGIVQATGAVVFNRVDIVSVHYCHQVGPANPSRSGLLFGVHARLARMLKRVAERIAFRVNRTATFVCVSDGLADELHAHYPLLRGRVSTIHNGVDSEAFAPGAGRDGATALRERLGIAPERLVAAFVGSEWERKGLASAIAALARAPAWDLVVAGDGDRARYARLAGQLGVGQSVHWLGLTSEVQALYGLADAFVFPSSYETFSLVTYEAAASGLPLLGTPVSGVRELIRDGENGFSITRDPDLIAQRLRSLAADPALRARLGEGARRSVAPYSWQRMVARHAELYDRLGSAKADRRQVSLRSRAAR